MTDRNVMQRKMLMIEVDESTTESELEGVPGVQVWGEVDPTAAALMVLDQHLPTAA